MEHFSKIDGSCGLQLDTKLLETDYARRIYYENAKVYVPPEKVTLGSRGIAYYIPLGKLLEPLMCHPYFSEHFKAPALRSTDGMFRDFCDGFRFKAHPSFRENLPNTIKMVLYADEIELANALGMKRGWRGKLTMFYISFVNFPPSHRSKLCNIFLIAVRLLKDLKNMDAETQLLQNFVNAVNVLADIGLALMCNGTMEHLKGYLLGFIRRRTVRAQHSGI